MNFKGRKTLLHSTYSIRPLVIPAKLAHESKAITYESSGEVVLSRTAIEAALETPVAGDRSVRVPPTRQFPIIFSTFMDLSKALSTNANSPKLATGESLRERFDVEFSRYRELVEVCFAQGSWEPDYGSYVFDAVSGRLFLIAPEYWHRIALTTSGGSLLQDASKSMHWAQVRERLEGATIGVMGASVGSNVIESLCRELRPRRMKIADPDWIELTNLNRLERASCEFLVQSRASRIDLRNPFELHRFNKAEVSAYQQNLVDPYAEFFVYPLGIDEGNLDRFLLGDGREPRLELLIDEVDDLALKVRVRKRCRELGIPVLMMSDFGHLAVSHFQDFSKNGSIPISYDCSDEVTERLLKRAQSTGDRSDFLAFVEQFVGPACIREEFGEWVEGKGEQPTSSIPQSGATAMLSGGIAAKLAARYLLGHQIPSRMIYNSAQHSLHFDAEGSIAP